MLRIFISSVQKELELERAAIASLITTDPFLIQHCVPVLFDKEPPAPRPAQQPYLDALRTCAIYVLLVANEYGRLDGSISATHQEYRLAQKMKLPSLVFLKGSTPAIEARLNPRQKRIVLETQRSGFVTSGWCQKRFKVVRDTANRDLVGLVQLGLLEPVGKGRGARYVLKTSFA